MSNWTREEDYELFQGDLRRLDELVAQLELWCDEKTINHKKEQERLEEYVELESNLEELKASLAKDIEENKQNSELSELAHQAEMRVATKLEAYKVTEEAIYTWIREINNIQVLIMRSSLLIKYKGRLDEILAQ